MDILSNGLDSYKKAIHFLNELESGDIIPGEYEFKVKDIIMMLHHATETLFKHMLIKVNSKELVWENIDKSCEASLFGRNVSNPKSVSFFECYLALLLFE